MTEQRGTKRRQPLTEDRKREFIRELSIHGIVSEAARVASPASEHPRGARTTFYDERRRDVAFADEWDDAVDEANAALEREIHRRGVEGFTEERVDHLGRLTTMTKYSDACILAMARARLPSFAKSEVQVRGEVEHEHRFDPNNLNAEQRDLVLRLCGTVIDQRQN